MNQSDLEVQILLLLDGELPAGKAAVLEAKLLEDRDARETYGKLALLHNALETRYAVGAAVEQMAVVPVERIILRQRRRMVKGSLLAAAAILLVSAVTMWQILSPDRPVPVGSVRTAPDSLLSLTYDGEGEAPNGSRLAAGSRLRLTAGTMEGVFESGVRLVAEAPCDLRVLTGDRVALEKGVAWFRVPPDSVGFAVETPELVVVDLGTEFGVISSPGGANEIHVIEGTVEVTSRREAGSKQTLNAGLARRMNPRGQLSEIAADPSRFRDRLEATRAITIDNHSFELDVLPRDGDRATHRTKLDDYDRDTIPTGWDGFDDGDGGTGGTRGILSTAPDSFFNESLDATPDADANDQVYYSAARDIYQVLGEPLQPNSSYTLSIDIGDRARPGGEGHPGNPGVRLGVGPTPGEGLLQPDSTWVPPQVDGGWVTWRVTYRTGASPPGRGEPLRIELTSGSRVGWFDNVRLTVAR
jgi:ferric-dicitrate binding protein FerR (iron transport regulator)